jgi:signal peptidase II
MGGKPSIAWRWLVLIMAVVLAADQLTKHVIETYTSPDYSQVIVPGLLNFIHTHNPGVAFSLFANAQSAMLRPVLVIFSMVVILFLFWLLAEERAGGRPGQTGMALILGGAVGNVLDRFTQRGVVDFIDLHISVYHWPTFNLADSAIVVGAALVLLELSRDWTNPNEGRGKSKGAT